MDYTHWTMDELEKLRMMLAAEAAGAAERDAVAGEIQRRQSAAPLGPGGFAVAATAGQGMPHEEAAVQSYGQATNRRSTAGLEYVGVPLRGVAQLIDFGVFFVLAFVVALMSGGASSSSAGGTHTAAFHLGGTPLLIWSLISLAYYVFCEKLLGGTPGKLALGLRVVDEDRNPITWGASIIRNLMRIVDGLFLYVVGAVAVSSSPTEQRYGDRVAHTYVVRR